tara:strand:- start:37 stop:213 length:177 start_codon:yes stop_codon:yes gene_type:complete
MNTFQEVIKCKVDKDSGVCHLSIKTSDTKVEVFKLTLSDMTSLMTQFRGQMDAKPKRK